VAILSGMSDYANNDFDIQRAVTITITNDQPYSIWFRVLNEYERGWVVNTWRWTNNKDHNRHWQKKLIGYGQSGDTQASVLDDGERLF